MVSDEVCDGVREVWLAAFTGATGAPSDNFFELGGDSVTAVGIAAELGDRFGLELPVEIFFDAATLGELTDAVSEALDGEYEAAPPPVTPRPRG